jgi:hypothetical protein
MFGTIGHAVLAERRKENSALPEGKRAHAAPALSTLMASVNSRRICQRFQGAVVVHVLPALPLAGQSEMVATARTACPRGPRAADPKTENFVTWYGRQGLASATPIDARIAETECATHVILLLMIDL